MDDAYKRRLEEIYKSHYDRYIRYAAYLLHNSNQAEDMVHEAFLLAVAHEDKSKDHPEAWIMKALKNVCMNRIKKYAVRKPKLDDFMENQPTAEPSFDVTSDTMIALKQELSPEDYGLLDQYCFQHKTVQEISDATGLSPNHIHVRIYRIRKMIIQLFFSLLVILQHVHEI